MAFYEALVSAEVHEGHIKEELKFFEGCVPIEELARRGPETMRYGPMRPVGLIDPRTGKRPYAVVQLRKENIGATLLNLVGFQTRLKWGEQKESSASSRRLRRSSSALASSPQHLSQLPKVLFPTYQARPENLLFAGQITGSRGTWNRGLHLIAGINGARLVKGEEPSRSLSRR